MASRRDLLKGVAAASALPLAAKLHPVWASGRQGGEAARIPAVYDGRFPSSVAFAKALQSSGSEIHCTDGDITDLWYETLHHRWRGGAAPIAGLTAHGALFCLERLGWTYGLRLTYRAQHIERGDGTAEHASAGPQALDAEIKYLKEAGRQWPQTLAHLLSHDPRAASTPLPTIYVGPNDSHSSDFMQAEREPLFSWILAPVRRS